MLPTDEQMLKEIRAISTLAPHLMQCFNCKHYDRATSECGVNHFKMAPFVRGCNGMYFLAREEELLYKAKKELQNEQDDCEKIENLLALMITTIGAAQCFGEDLNRRLRKLRQRTKDKQQRSGLRKDLDMVEEVSKALDRIMNILGSADEMLQTKMDEADRQFNMYIEHHINRLFTKQGKWDEKRGSGYLNNNFDISRLIGKFVRGCICNEANHDAVFSFLDSLENEHPYGLTNEDFEHYKLKGFEW